MSDETRLTVEKIILLAIDRYIAENKCVRYWDEPIVGFADASSPLFGELKEKVNPLHKVPTDFLPNARTVISYFLPYTRSVGNSNLEGKEPSQLWIDAYHHSNKLTETVDDYIRRVLSKHGYSVASTGYSAEINDSQSTWSQCRVAWISGLGAWGTNNRVITKHGCCGRFYSVVTDMPLKCDEPVTADYCYRKSMGKGCGKCVDRCVSGALKNNGINYNECREIPVMNGNLEDEELCGKCMVGLPCSFQIP